MATITVLDSVGATQTVAKVTATGATTGANALPVVIATDDAMATNINTITTRTPALGSAAAASSTPVALSTEDIARIGATNETAAAADTSTAGLNGLLKRNNQNLTTIHTDLTSTNTQLPTTVSGSVQVTITRPANTTAYTANDVLGGAITIATGLTSGQRGMITGVDLMPQISAVPAGMASMRLYLYNVTPPSATADNGAWDLPSGDRASFLGYVDIGTPVDLGSTCFVEVDGVNKQFQLSGSSNLFGYLVTTGGFTPAANSEVYLLRLQFVGL